MNERPGKGKRWWGTDRHRDDEAGQGLAEYALILAFIAIAAASALGLLGGAIANSPGFRLF